MSISQIRPASRLEHLTFVNLHSRIPIKGIILDCFSRQLCLAGTLLPSTSTGPKRVAAAATNSHASSSLWRRASRALPGLPSGPRGSLLFHVTHDSVEAIQIMLVTSIAMQAYSVWKLRSSIVPSSLIPVFRRRAPRPYCRASYLLLNTPLHIYLLALGGRLVT